MQLGNTMKSSTLTRDRSSTENLTNTSLKTRMRRLRSSSAIRSMVQETHLRLDKLIMPLFICEGNKVKNEIPAMPGIHQLSIDTALAEVDQLAKLGLNAILLFGIPLEKDAEASQAWAENVFIQRANREIKK